MKPTQNAVSRLQRKSFHRSPKKKSSREWEPDLAAHKRLVCIDGWPVNQQGRAERRQLLVRGTSPQRLKSTHTKVAVKGSCVGVLGYGWCKFIMVPKGEFVTAKWFRDQVLRPLLPTLKRSIVLMDNARVHWGKGDNAESNKDWLIANGVKFIDGHPPHSHRILSREIQSNMRSDRLTSPTAPTDWKAMT